MRRLVILSCIFVLNLFLAVYQVATDDPMVSVVVSFTASAIVFCGVISLAITYGRRCGEDQGAGTIKREKDLLEDQEIYEVMALVRLEVDRRWVAILRLKNDELRTCFMDVAPSTKVFKVRKDERSRTISKFAYPPKDLQGEITKQA